MSTRSASGTVLTLKIKSPDVVDAGHKNGVKVIGTVFMPQVEHGGKMEWLEDLLTKNEDGSYPVAEDHRDRSPVLLLVLRKI